jgi:hypothetical protein
MTLTVTDSGRSRRPLMPPADAQRQGEHADRRGDQHPSHDDHHRPGQGVGLGQRAARDIRQPGQRKAQDGGEDDELRDVAFDGRLEGIGGARSSGNRQSAGG